MNDIDIDLDRLREFAKNHGPLWITTQRPLPEEVESRKVMGGQAMTFPIDTSLVFTLKRREYKECTKGKLVKMIVKKS